MRLNCLALGLAGGITWALCVFLLGLAAWLGNWGGEMVDMLASAYIGYSASFGGAFIGAIWAFVDAFIGLLIFAFFYNLFVPRPKES